MIIIFYHTSSTDSDILKCGETLLTESVITESVITDGVGPIFWKNGRDFVDQLEPSQHENTDIMCVSIVTVNNTVNEFVPLCQTVNTFSYYGRRHYWPMKLLFVKAVD